MIEIQAPLSVSPPLKPAFWAGFLCRRDQGRLRYPSLNPSLGEGLDGRSRRSLRSNISPTISRRENSAGRLMAPIPIYGAPGCVLITGRLSFSAIFDNLHVVHDGGVVIFGRFCRCGRHQLRRRTRFGVFLSPWASLMTAADTLSAIFVTSRVAS